MSDNPYEILGVDKSASDKEIKAAYRRLAKSLHPDLNPGDSESEARFKAVSAAYNLLGDKEKRAQFDRGEIDASGAESPRNPYYRDYAGDGAGQRYYSSQGFSDFADESDFFSDLFGKARHEQRQYGQRQYGQQQRAGAFKGADIRYHLTVDFLDAARGAKRRVTMPDGMQLDIAIPAGVRDGQVLRLKGKGLPGHGGGSAGDAFVTVETGPHPHFKREGLNILLDLPVTLDEAVLGGKVKVPTIHGSVSVPIPAGSSSGRTLRLKGKGIGAKGGEDAGNQYVTLRVVLPPEIDKELADFMTRWREKNAYNVRQDLETET
ncbi:DnaJ C-terminal domain-containing protein [Kordiimonas sp.]|uniref:DnaJ C-terminal domain-containing protein n=1 Tax=Kordiimonas sp. TaxID=1970157 RepID=UPI003A8CDD1B